MFYNKCKPIITKGVCSMKYVSFSEDEKAKMFDKIASQFYQANFGQMSKSDFELLMFHFYIDKMISQNKNEDGSIEYNKISDYKISKDLGITQQKVRNLKVKNQLIYPIDFDWKLALSRLTKEARYDRTNHKIMLNIPDPNLFYEIQNFIEEQGAYIEKQLNSKILQIRVEYYIDLVLSLDENCDKKKILKKLKKDFKDAEKENNKFDDKNIGHTLMQIGRAGYEIVDIINSLSNLVNPGNIVWKALSSLVLGQNII